MHAIGTRQDIDEIEKQLCCKVHADEIANSAKLKIEVLSPNVLKDIIYTVYIVYQVWE